MLRSTRKRITRAARGEDDLALELSMLVKVGLITDKEYSLITEGN